MPAFIANYPAQYKRILGYLKELGVSHIYSVSFGADICTWGYHKYFEKTGKKIVLNEENWVAHTSASQQQLAYVLGEQNVIFK